MSAVSPSATLGFIQKGAGNEITRPLELGKGGLRGVGWEISREGSREGMK